MKNPAKTYRPLHARYLGVLRQACSEYGLAWWPPQGRINPLLKRGLIEPFKKDGSVWTATLAGRAELERLTAARRAR